MAVFVTADENARTEFEIPVSWEVFDKVKVQANSLEEAFNYVKDHLDEIPLGNDADYVEASYRISADNIDECIGYQPINDVVCLEFECDDNLEKYKDSMLFDSTSMGGDSIAAGTFEYKNQSFTVYLDVCGEVNVTYKDKTYDKPSEFPCELRNLIESNPSDWTRCEDVYVSFNNWFEYIFNSDGKMLAGDLSQMSKEDVLNSMYAIARNHFAIKAK